MYLPIHPILHMNPRLEEVTANNYEQLNDLASYSYIEKIYVSPEHEYEPMLEEATEAIGVADYIDTGTLTGEDIVIGILDTRNSQMKITLISIISI